MCGISGIFDPGHKIDNSNMEGGIGAMMSELGYRGPDDRGTYFDTSAGLGLGHVRLSIIDLSGGRQPMSNADGTLQIVFNGEIYNFMDERQKLQAAGYRFKTNSDTEVILALYERYGESAWSHLRGQFAFGLWDANQKALYLVRDRLGEKPLAYSYTNGVLRFASEVKALMRSPGISAQLDRSILGLYLLMQHVPPPFTLYRDVQKLPPGYFLKATADGIVTKSYWRPNTELGFTNRSEQQIIDQFRGLFEEAVKLCTVSDVPIGTYLSGGLDSTSVTWAARQASSSPLQTFAIFNQEDHEKHPDWPYAQEAAKYLKTDHHNVFYDLPGLMALIPEFIDRTDEPFQGPTALVSLHLSKAARERVKVVLTGSGGDELLGGYQSYYQRVLQMQKLWQGIDQYIPRQARQWIGSAFGGLHAGFARMGLSPEERRIAAGMAYHGKWFKLICPELAEQTRKHFMESLQIHHVQQQPNYFKRYLWQDLMVDHNHAITTLPDATGMACSLESRNPFLDYRLVEFLTQVDPNLLIRKTYQNKYLLIKAMQSRIPDSILYRPKEGFSGMTEAQMVKWMRTQGRKLFREQLLESSVVTGGYLPKKGIEELWSHFDSAQTPRAAVYYLVPIWSAAMLALWHDRHTKQT